MERRLGRIQARHPQVNDLFEVTLRDHRRPTPQQMLSASPTRHNRERPPGYCTKLECVHKQLIIHEILVEATGVEPASENVTGQETTCLFAFMPWALPQDLRGRRSERTRNASR